MVQISSILVLCMVALVIFALVQRHQSGGGSSFGKNKNGMLRAEDLNRKPKAVQHNSTKTDVQNLLVFLLRYAKKHKEVRVVCPGRVEYEGRQCGATMLLVGPFGVQSIHCFGFGGSVSPADTGSDWVQKMNGQVKTILNPVQVNQEDNAAMRQILKANGYKDVPVYSCGVFTQEDVALHAGGASGLYTSQQFKDWLNADALRAREASVTDVQALTDLLAKLAGIPDKKKS